MRTRVPLWLCWALVHNDEGANAIIHTAHEFDLALATAMWINRFDAAEFGRDGWDAKLAAEQARATGHN